MNPHTAIVGVVLIVVGLLVGVAALWWTGCAVILYDGLQSAGGKRC